MDETRRKHLDGALKFAFELTQSSCTGGRYTVVDDDETSARCDVTVTRKGETSAAFYVDLRAGIVCSSATDQEILFL